MLALLALLARLPPSWSAKSDSRAAEAAFGMSAHAQP